MNKDIFKVIIIVLVCAIIVIGYVSFLKALFRNDHICNEGSQKGRFTQDEITYLECGTYGKYTWTDMIKDNKIVREKVYVINETSHIETFKANWTDSKEITLYVVVGLIMCMGCILIGLVYLLDILKGR